MPLFPRFLSFTWGFLALVGLTCPVLAQKQQPNDSTKSAVQTKAGGFLKGLGKGLSAAGQKVAGGAAQVAGTVLQEKGNGRRRINHKNGCLSGDCRNGKGFFRHMLDEKYYLIYYSSFRDGKAEGWAKCFDHELKRYNPTNPDFFIFLTELPEKAAPSLEVEFSAGKMTGKGRINNLDDTYRVGKKQRLFSHYEGQIDSLGRMHGLGKLYNDTAHYSHPLKPTLSIDSLVTDKGTYKFAAKVYEHEFPQGNLKSLVVNAVYKVTDGGYIGHLGSLPTHIRSGREIRYATNGRVAWEANFIGYSPQGGSYEREYTATTIYMPDGSIAYRGKADNASLLASKGACLSGNCQNGEGSYRWVRQASENYGTIIHNIIPTIFVTKGRFANGKPVGQHRVTLSTGAQFVGILTPQFTLQWGEIRQDNGIYQGSFNASNMPNGGQWIYYGVPQSDPMHTVAGVSMAVVQSGSNSRGVGDVKQLIARQFTHDMHLGTVNKEYTQLESPLQLTLLDSITTLSNFRLHYRIDWGAQGTLQTTVYVKPTYDPVQETIRFDYTIDHENEAAKQWRLKAADFEASELARLGLNVAKRTGQLTANVGKRTLWSSDVTTYTETRQQWKGYDPRAGAVYEEVKEERADRFIKSYRVPVTYLCDGKSIGKIEFLVFNEVPNVLSTSSIFSWAGTHLLLGMGGLRENSVFAGQYGYVNFQEAVTDMSRKVQRLGCAYKAKP